jgi:hypothetical protein
MAWITHENSIGSPPHHAERLWARAAEARAYIRSGDEVDRIVTLMWDAIVRGPRTVK